MKKHLLLLLLTFFCSQLQLRAQVVSRIDFDDIRQQTTNSASPYYFPEQLKRLLAADSTLRQDDYKYLYYGQVFDKSYRPYEADKSSKEFREAFDRQEYARAIELGRKDLQLNPLNLKLLVKLIVCHSRQGDRAGAQRYANQYYGLVYAIVASGDGQSAATAFVAVAVPDEYRILDYYDLAWSSQSLQGSTDVFKLKAAGSAPPNAASASSEDANRFTGEQIYFDASRPLAYLRGQFKK